MLVYFIYLYESTLEDSLHAPCNSVCCLQGNPTPKPRKRFNLKPYSPFVLISNAFHGAESFKHSRPHRCLIFLNILKTAEISPTPVCTDGTPQLICYYTGIGRGDNYLDLRSNTF